MARDFKKITRCTQSKILGYLKKMQAGFGGFEHELLKKLHYELWNAEIHKIWGSIQKTQADIFLISRDASLVLKRLSEFRFSWVFEARKSVRGVTFAKGRLLQKFGLRVDLREQIASKIYNFQHNYEILYNFAHFSEIQKILGSIQKSASWHLCDFKKIRTCRWNASKKFAGLSIKRKLTSLWVKK